MKFRIRTVSNLAAIVILVAIFTTAYSKSYADGIVVGHDINTLTPSQAGIDESRFALNVADFITSSSPNANLLLFESNPGDATRDFAPAVLDALTSNGYNVTLTSDYQTPFNSFDAIFVSLDFPAIEFLDNQALIDFANSGGGIYLAGGAGSPESATAEANGWATFLNHFGLGFDSSYNGLTNVVIDSSHPLFDGVSELGCNLGSPIVEVGNDPRSQIVQFAGGQGVYAVVTIPEPASNVLLIMAFAALSTRRAKLLSNVR